METARWWRCCSTRRGGGCSTWWTRRFDRSRYDAELTVATFAARLQDATDLDGVRADLAATVDDALEPGHLSLGLGNERLRS